MRFVQIIEFKTGDIEAFNRDWKHLRGLRPQGLWRDVTKCRDQPLGVPL